MRGRDLGARLLQGGEGAEQYPSGKDHKELLAALPYAAEADETVIQS